MSTRSVEVVVILHGHLSLIGDEISQTDRQMSSNEGLD
jgi:hypothetical protein